VGADGLSVDTEKFEMKRGANVVVRVTAEPLVVAEDAANATDSAPAATVVEFPGKPIINEPFDDPRLCQLSANPGTGAKGEIAQGSYFFRLDAQKAGENLTLPIALGLQSGAFFGQCRTFNSNPFFNFCARSENDRTRFLSLSVKNGNWHLYVARQTLENGVWKPGPATRIAFDNVVDPRLMSGQWIELAARWSTEDYDVWLNGKHIAGGVLPEEFKLSNANPIQFCARSHSAGVTTLELASIRVWDQSGIMPADAAPKGLPTAR
jgi:hypothetical protein